jgi:hypothetical protein
MVFILGLLIRPLFIYQKRGGTELCTLSFVLFVVQRGSRRSQMFGMALQYLEVFLSTGSRFDGTILL